MLAFSVKVSEVAESVETHYGHEEPGQDLKFQIKVEMQDDLPDKLVKCGWLAGADFPKKGPILGVTIQWTSVQGSLEKHGVLQCGTPCTTKTVADGIATLIFKPKNEEQPFGIGMTYQESGVMSGIAYYLSKHKNMLGSFNQVATPK